MIYGLAQYARYDMEHNPIPNQQQKQRHAAAATDVEQEKSKKELEKRLSAVETTLKTIITTLEKNATPPSGGSLSEQTTPVQPQATPSPKPP